MVSRIGEENLLMHFSRSGVGKVSQFHKQVREHTLDTKAKLLVLDSNSDTFAGNENDRGQVKQFVGMALGSIALAMDGAVVLCAHPSRAGMSNGTGESGSTGWEAAFRSRAYLHSPEPENGAPPSANERILTRKKANYASRDEKIPMVWTNGVFRLKQEARNNYRAPVEDVFLSLLDAMNGEKRFVSHNPHAMNYAPRAFSKNLDRQGYAKADFERTMERLFAD